MPTNFNSLLALISGRANIAWGLDEGMPATDRKSFLAYSQPNSPN